MAHAAWKWMVVVAGVGAGVLACSENGGGGGLITFDAGVNKERPGFGEDPGAPVGNPFNFPPGIELAGDPYGASDADGDCGNGVAPQGTGQGVLVCVPLRNLSGAPVTMTFEPALVMLSASASRYQNGMLMDRIRITIPPTGIGPGGIDAGPDAGSEEKPFLVPLHMYCINEKRAPSEEGVPYRLGPVSTDPDILTLLRLLQNKAIKSQDDITIVQDALYNITEYNGLTSEDERRIASLPKG
ncbi:putative lipoprotein [Myxococcus stipitatus DSM 14675]|uniref:Putative lipoprotein n=1 Tax=Myxococcus stipitatus (strain DSM 14675 / JCM 12634 / Mx s8) TaxID=1278073 RepID=L7UEU2_MYXSD|nr:hypothetical protein [Myxococcus stipitatus]AGC46390.1 putative lipoprotein [Myxococcus stipitatus DSM 14675]